jgi:inhibitor of cysteine peptidase
MLLTDQDCGRTVETAIGNIVTVRLKESPTTGYQWSVDGALGLELARDHFDAGGAIGASGVRIFDFRATRVGSYQLRLRKWREWEGEASTLERCDINIIVK